MGASSPNGRFYIIKQKGVERRLADLAQYDALTGLANRSMFDARLADAIAQAKRTRLDMALLLLDLDRFKDVNDTMGHPVGDLLLKAVSERLIGCLRETDTVARLSGDEFAIIATNLSRTRDAAELARKIIDELARPYDLTGKEVSINSSVGVSLFGPEVENASKLLSDADAALYQAKNGGRGIFRFFDDEMNQKEQARKGLEMDLRKAMDGRQFFLQFQPKLDIENRHVVGAEALLRWNHPARGLVAPDQAIPIAEATGLIIPIGDWVIREACKQVAAWQRGGLPPIPIAVNTSALQFKRPGLLDTVTEALAEGPASRPTCSNWRSPRG